MPSLPDRRNDLRGQVLGDPLVGADPAAGALLEVGERLDVLEQPGVLLAHHVAVEPAQLHLGEAAVAGAADLGAGRSLQVVPGTPDHPGRHAVLLQALEQQRRAALEQVVLAADEEGRHLHLVDHVDRGALVVERPVVRRLPAQDGVDHQRHGEADRGHQVVGEHLEAGGRLVDAVRRRDQAGAGDQAEPERDEADVDLAAGGDDVAVDVGAGHLREDRLQPGGLVGRGEDLGDAHVGRAHHADAAVAPRRAVRPLDDGGGVLGLAGAERLPNAGGRAGAAGVDDERGVAALHEVLGIGAGEHGAGAGAEHGLVVRRDRHQHRHLAGHRLAVGEGREDQVAAQDHAVVHPDRDVLGGDRLRVLLRPRLPLRCFAAAAAGAVAASGGRRRWGPGSRCWRWVPGALVQVRVRRRADGAATLRHVMLSLCV